MNCLISKQSSDLDFCRNEERLIFEYPKGMAKYLKTGRTSSKLPLVLLFIFVLSGCQTSRYREFEKIKGGMSKGEVLSAIGGPNRTQRWHGRDRWEYTLYGHPDGDLVREVHFEDGVSTYIGPAIKPAVSADLQDQINERRNRAADLSEASGYSSSSLEVQRFEPVDDDADSKSAR